MPDWFSLTWAEALGVGVSVVVVYVAIILMTRLTGLRSFSKMAASDFAMTVAVGSVFASSIITPDPSMGIAVLALAGLFAGQFVLAWVRRRSKVFRTIVDNEPILLMDGSRLIDENLERANVSEDDVRAKLREANVLDLSQVRAVVFETTGDVSVLHTADPDQRLHDVLLEDVRR